MVKKLLRILVVLVVLIVLAGAVLWLYIDRVATAALTKGVEYAGDVPCEVDGVSISLLAGSVRVEGMVVKNPRDYPVADMFAVRRADLDVRLGSLWNQPIHVEKLEIVKPLVRVEAGKGGSNVQVFLSNVQDKLGTKETQPEDGPQTRMVVDKLLIKDAVVRIGSGVLSDSAVDIELETIELTDIRGKNGQGVTPGELSAKIVFQLVKAGAVKGKLDLNQLVPKDLTKGFEQVTRTAETILKSATELIKSPLETLLKPKEDSDPAP